MALGSPGPAPDNSEKRSRPVALEIPATSKTMDASSGVALLALNIVLCSALALIATNTSTTATSPPREMTEGRTYRFQITRAEPAISIGMIFTGRAITIIAAQAAIATQRPELNRA